MNVLASTGARYTTLMTARSFGDLIIGILIGTLRELGDTGKDGLCIMH